MVAIVIVAHSHRLAEGVREVASQMGGGSVTILAAGGYDENALGTNVDRVLEALSAADNPDGVIVLMDLGSAVLTSEMAIEMLPPEKRGRIRLCPAPLVEGAVAAAAQAATGSSLAEVDSAARRAATLVKIAREQADGPESANRPDGAVDTGKMSSSQVTLRVRDAAGLHARPAAEFVRMASAYSSRITVRNLDRPGREANAKSIVEVLSLGIEQGHTIALSAEGDDRVAALQALTALIHGQDPAGFR